MNQIADIVNSFPIVFSLIVLAMACYSVTRLIVTDDFPLFEKPREWLKLRFPPSGTTWKKRPPERVQSRALSSGIWAVDQGHWIGDLISCPWCAGWWVSLAATILFFITPTWTIALCIPFALRAFVGGYANKIGGG